jgi:hypothetical protein
MLGLARNSGRSCALLHIGNGLARKFREKTVTMNAADPPPGAQGAAAAAARPADAADRLHRAAQLFVFGYAVTTDVKHVATALLDQDRSVQSRDLPSASCAPATSTSCAADGGRGRRRCSTTAVQAALVIPGASPAIWPPSAPRGCSC